MVLPPPTGEGGGRGRGGGSFVLDSGPDIGLRGGGVFELGVAFEEVLAGATSGGRLGSRGKLGEEEANGGVVGSCVLLGVCVGVWAEPEGGVLGVGLGVDRGFVRLGAVTAIVLSSPWMRGGSAGSGKAPLPVGAPIGSGRGIWLGGSVGNGKDILAELGVSD